ncbi:tRNA (adenosine(37)-N6)-dimethylallyltransferase MiaA [Nocardioides marmoribigeumensis]|uniref:tRNA dimethylallyltransferase n=1 Tax=Nocardioides marmoribigeumensis TaxID=433649 RepID=A0ABU2BPC4_9ACTN|nr:tRNA (adenosine(37)-N6)-dimethylallyltransferase MiaA [Nocardioides marmoribigeumensis]MDR7360489.1 tRNA dimethylallyltransferase [Nocardioides marmoribigeumensis]
MSDGSSHLPVVALVGPTAVGKSELALRLAEELDGEVVNTDAMQLYRGMDIGTAKLTVEERRGVPHHLLDVLDVREPASVAEFQRWARDAVAEIRGRGRLPVLAGGSALYTRSVVDRFEFPGTDATVRRALEERLEAEGPEALHAELARTDPEAAERILPTNGRRVVRALEVVQLTGRPFSASLPRLEYADPLTVQVGLDCDRATLDERIAVRVDRMWEQGLVAEVERLVGEGLREGRTARSALGYAQVLDLLDGRFDEAEARRSTVQSTRRFVRRQESWFRKDPRISWVPWTDPLPAAVAVVRATMRGAASG